MGEPERDRKYAAVVTDSAPTVTSADEGRGQHQSEPEQGAAFRERFAEWFASYAKTSQEVLAAGLRDNEEWIAKTGRLPTRMNERAQLAALRQCVAEGRERSCGNEEREKQRADGEGQQSWRGDESPAFLGIPEKVADAEQLPNNDDKHVVLNLSDTAGPEARRLENSDQEIGARAGGSDSVARSTSLVTKKGPNKASNQERLNQFGVPEAHEENEYASAHAPSSSSLSADVDMSKSAHLKLNMDYRPTEGCPVGSSVLVKRPRADSCGSPYGAGRSGDCGPSASSSCQWHGSRPAPTSSAAPVPPPVHIFKSPPQAWLRLAFPQDYRVGGSYDIDELDAYREDLEDLEVAIENFLGHERFITDSIDDAPTDVPAEEPQRSRQRWARRLVAQKQDARKIAKKGSFPLSWVENDRDRSKKSGVVRVEEITVPACEMDNVAETFAEMVAGAPMSEEEEDEEGEERDADFEVSAEKRRKLSPSNAAEQEALTQPDPGLFWQEVRDHDQRPRGAGCQHCADVVEDEISNSGRDLLLGAQSDSDLRGKSSIAVNIKQNKREYTSTSTQTVDYLRPGPGKEHAETQTARPLCEFAEAASAREALEKIVLLDREALRARLDAEGIACFRADSAPLMCARLIVATLSLVGTGSKTFDRGLLERGLCEVAASLLDAAKNGVVFHARMLVEYGCGFDAGWRADSDSVRCRNLLNHEHVMRVLRQLTNIYSDEDSSLPGSSEAPKIKTCAKGYLSSACSPPPAFFDAKTVSLGAEKYAAASSSGSAGSAAHSRSGNQSYHHQAQAQSPARLGAAVPDPRCDVTPPRRRASTSLEESAAAPPLGAGSIGPNSPAAGENNGRSSPTPWLGSYTPFEDPPTPDGPAPILVEDVRLKRYCHKLFQHSVPELKKICKREKVEFSACGSKREELVAKLVQKNQPKAALAQGPEPRLVDTVCALFDYAGDRLRENLRAMERAQRQLSLTDDPTGADWAKDPKRKVEHQTRLKIQKEEAMAREVAGILLGAKW